MGSGELVANHAGTCGMDQEEQQSHWMRNPKYRREPFGKYSTDRRGT